MEAVKKQGTESLFVPYKIALELKELGFDEPCFGSIDQIGYIHVKGSKSSPRGSMMYNTIDCPTFSQAFRFFREKYGLHYIICKNIQMDGYGYREVILIPYMEENENTIFKTYEEAELECIKKLIEIAKEQNVK